MRKYAAMLLMVAAGVLMSSHSALAAEPGKQAPQAQPQKHVVAEGESLSSIAVDNNLDSWRPIWNANTDLVNPDVINPGQQLVVPNGPTTDRPLPAGYGETQTRVVLPAQPAHAAVGHRTAVYATPSGDLAHRVCLRESGCNYATNTGNGYYGAYQYDDRTWGGYGGYAHASDAPPAVQDAKFAQTFAARGCSPWPNTCY
jgi:LysM repeat protein